MAPTVRMATKTAVDLMTGNLLRSG
jgi:hypothetical protein